MKLKLRRTVHSISLYKISILLVLYEYFGRFGNLKFP